jgi:hypothetical protein
MELLRKMKILSLAFGELSLYFFVSKIYLLRHRAICCCSAYSLKPTRALLFEIDMFFGEKASDCWPSVFNW